PLSVSITQPVRRFSLSGAMSCFFSGSAMASLLLLRLLGQGTELGNQLRIKLAFERYDQLRQRRHRRPLPGAELGMGAVDRDVAVGAGEAEGDPLLLLPPIAALPQPRHQVGRQVIAIPAAALRQQGRRPRADLFLHLAPGGGLRRLALV